MEWKGKERVKKTKKKASRARGRKRKGTILKKADKYWKASLTGVVGA